MVAMKVRDLLGQLDLGNSVAEFDDSLERHFVETESFRALVSGRYDVIAGDKGTGKTALYRSLLKRYRDIPELLGVEVITAFNPSGNPLFQRLTQIPPLLEGQCITVWKAFFLSLVGNWLLEVFHDAPTEALRELDRLLTHVGLRSRDESAATIFSKVVSTFSRLTQPKSAEVGFTLSDAGLPVITPKVEFGEATKTEGSHEVIPHEQALALLNRALDDLDTVVWIVMDRLDEAFQGYPETERPALRALLRTYLDLLEFPRLRLKLFVRKDLFRKIVQGGFVNLTHVNARRLDIVWDEEDLRNLLCRRIRGSEALASALTLSNATDSAAFDAGSDDSEERKHSDMFLSSLIEPALSGFGLEVVRADKISQPGLITSQVIEHVLRSKLVIVDLSFHNPNVFYEMALRHATKLPVVQICRRKDRLPFDVNQVRTISLDTTDIYTLIPKLETYRSEIASQVRAALDGQGSSNPISVFFPGFVVTVPKAI
jgi:hypothetical protein